MQDKRLLLRQLDCFLREPAVYIRGGATAVDAVISGLLLILCRSENRELDWEEARKFWKSPLGAVGLFCYQLSSTRTTDPNWFVPEVASVFAEVAHYLGFTEPIEGEIEARQIIRTKLIESLRHSNLDEDEAILQFGPPSWIVNGDNHKVFCYSGKRGEKWSFLDFDHGWLRSVRINLRNEMHVSPKGRIFLNER